LVNIMNFMNETESKNFKTTTLTWAFI
jgi:hypothetical protein